MIASWMLFALLVGALVTRRGAGARADGARRRASPTSLRLGRRAGPLARLAARQPRRRLLPAPRHRVTRASRSRSPLSRRRSSRADDGRDRRAARSTARSSCCGAGSARCSASAVAWRGGARADARARGSAATSTARAFACRTNVGPAVVGLRSMDVVIPEWITDARRAAARHRASPRGRAPRGARSVSAVRRGDRRGADAVEPRALDPGAAAASGDRDGLRRARAARASVARTIRPADADDRAASLGRRRRSLRRCSPSHHSTRTEDPRHADDDAPAGATLGLRRRSGVARRAGVRQLAAIGGQGFPRSTSKIARTHSHGSVEAPADGHRGNDSGHRRKPRTARGAGTRSWKSTESGR